MLPRTFADSIGDLLDAGRKMGQKKGAQRGTYDIDSACQSNHCPRDRADKQDSDEEQERGAMKPPK